MEADSLGSLGRDERDPDGPGVDGQPNVRQSCTSAVPEGIPQIVTQDGKLASCEVLQAYLSASLSWLRLSLHAPRGRVLEVAGSLPGTARHRRCLRGCKYLGYL
jgi:hypothetical protein